MRAALFLLVTSTACAFAAHARVAVAEAPPDRAAERAALVRELAADFGDDAIDRRVLDAIGTVPRHRFVPEAQAHAAYENRPLPIGHGQTISQPYIVALMTGVLEPRRDMRVLEIGAGSGYQAAILAGLVERVDTIEIVVPLAAQAKARLAALGYGNVEVRQADGYYGWPERAPYDAIIVTAAAGSIPPPLVAQLKPGGRMVIPVGAPFLTQTLVLVEKRGDGTLRTRQLLPVRFVPLTGEH